MPNHVSTNLVITGPKLDVERFVNAVNLSIDNTFNFQGVCPMPEVLVGTSAPAIIRTAEEIAQQWADYNTLKAEGKLDAYSLAEGKPCRLGITQEQYDSLLLNYGVTDWYSWCVKNWGTKWGAYDATSWDIVDGANDVASASISYQTAWSPATEFFLFASAKYPTLSFWQQVADEGGGFVGEQEFENGEVVENMFDWNSDDGIQTREALGMWSPEDGDCDGDGVALVSELRSDAAKIVPQIVPLPFGTYRN